MVLLLAMSKGGAHGGAIDSGSSRALLANPGESGTVKIGGGLRGLRGRCDGEGGAEFRGIDDVSSEIR